MLAYSQGQVCHRSYIVAASVEYIPEFNIRLYDKNSESDKKKIPPPKSEYFFQQHWESEYFFRKKKHNPPFPFKLNGPSLNAAYLAEKQQIPIS